MPKRATHIVNQNDPASFAELQNLVRPVERGGGGWVPDLEVRPFVYGTEEIRIVHLVQPDGDGEELVFTVSVGHGPEEQQPWYEKGYRIIHKDHIFAKNVVMTLVKKTEPKPSPIEEVPPLEPEPVYGEMGYFDEKKPVPPAVREAETAMEQMKREKQEQEEKL